MREGIVLTHVCVSVHTGGGVLTLNGEGTPTLGGEKYLPWMGRGGTYLGWGDGIPTLDDGWGTYLGLERGT